jgi:hypothetical protein
MVRAPLWWKYHVRAHSSDHERSNRSIMNTESGDHEHAPVVSWWAETSGMPLQRGDATDG